MPSAVDSPLREYLGRRRSSRLPLLPRSRCVQRRPHLLEQFLASVRFRDKPLEALGKHIPELALLGEATAQNHHDVLVQAAELIEDRIAIHHGKEEIQNDETDLLANLLVNFEGLEAGLGHDHAVP